MNKQDLKQRYLLTLYKEGSLLIKEKKFTLHHGGESHLYMNHSIFLSTYKNLDLLIQIYLKLLPKSLKDYKLGAVDSVMSPVLCGLMTGYVKKDIVIAKEKKMEHGIENKIYGNTTGEIILIDDVTTTGAILIHAAKALREKGAIVRYAILSACRDLSAIKNLKKEGIECFFIATYEEIIKESWNTLSSREKEIVLVEIKEKGYDWKINL